MPELFDPDPGPPGRGSCSVSRRPRLGRQGGPRRLPSPRQPGTSLSPRHCDSGHQGKGRACSATFSSISSTFIMMRRRRARIKPAEPDWVRNHQVAWSEMADQMQKMLILSGRPRPSAAKVYVILIAGLANILAGYVFSKCVLSRRIKSDKLIHKVEMEPIEKITNRGKNIINILRSTENQYSMYEQTLDQPNGRISPSPQNFMEFRQSTCLLSAVLVSRAYS